VGNGREITGGEGGGVIRLHRVNREPGGVEELGLEGLSHFRGVLGDVVVDPKEGGNSFDGTAFAPGGGFP